jgi:L-fucose isomerase-like protein
MSQRFEYQVVASRLHDEAAVERLTEPLRTVLDSIGGRPVGTRLGQGDRVDGAPTGEHPPPPLLYVVATGGTERAILDAVAQRRVGHGDEPVVLVAHRAHNSLPAALESLAAVHQGGGRGRIVFVTGDDDSDRRSLDEAVADLETIGRMRHTRLGIIGGPSSWLVASSPDASVVRRRWGPEVVTVEPTRMIELTRTPVVPTGVLADRFTRVADPKRSTVDEHAVSNAMAVHAALGDVLDEHRLDAVTVRCFDLLTDPGTSGCLALASLNDDGIVAGCEGDLPSALAMLLVRYLLGQPSWMANPATVDVEADTLVLAHCTVAPSMIDGFALDTHFESGQGVGISGHFATQPVTLVRVGGRDLDECWIVEGEIVATGDDADLCRTQVTVSLSPGAVRDLLERPLGNHLVLAAGHHGDRLRRWWSLAVADRR